MFHLHRMGSETETDENPESDDDDDIICLDSDENTDVEAKSAEQGTRKSGATGGSHGLLVHMKSATSLEMRHPP